MPVHLKSQLFMIDCEICDACQYINFSHLIIYSKTVANLNPSPRLDNDLSRIKTTPFLILKKVNKEYFSTLSHLNNGQHRALLWVKRRQCWTFFERFWFWIQFLGIDRRARDHLFHHRLTVELFGVVVFRHLDLDFPTGGEHWLRKSGTKSTSHRLGVIVFWLWSRFSWLSWVFHWEALLEVWNDMVAPLHSHSQFKPMDTLNRVKYPKPSRNGKWIGNRRGGDTSDQVDHLGMCHHCHQDAFNLNIKKRIKNEPRIKKKKLGKRKNENEIKPGKMKTKNKTRKRKMKNKTRQEENEE